MFARIRAGPMSVTGGSDRVASGPVHSTRNSSTAQKYRWAVPGSGRFNESELVYNLRVRRLRRVSWDVAVLRHVASPAVSGRAEASCCSAAFLIVHFMWIIKNVKLWIMWIVMSGRVDEQYKNKAIVDLTRQIRHVCIIYYLNRQSGTTHNTSYKMYS